MTSREWSEQGYCTSDYIAYFRLYSLFMEPIWLTIFCKLKHIIERPAVVAEWSKVLSQIQVERPRFESHWRHGTAAINNIKLLQWTRCQRNMVWITQSQK